MEVVPSEPPPAARRDSFPHMGVRQAVRTELVELFGSQAQFRETLHKEVQRALDDWSGYPRLPQDNQQCILAVPRPIARQTSPTASLDGQSIFGGNKHIVRQISPMSQGGEYVPGVNSHPVSTMDRTVSVGTSAKLTREPTSSAKLVLARKHFKDVIAKPSRSSSRLTFGGMDGVDGDRQRMTYLNTISSRLTSSFERELAKTSLVYQMVTSQAFEAVMRVAILLNCAFMVYVVNKEIDDPDSTSQPQTWVAEMCFVGTYLFEMILKLMAYRFLYFFDKSNCLDCVLVCIDVWDLVTKYMGAHILSTSYLRTFRLLKLGKALRAVQVAKAFDKLQAFLICIKGSMESLWWSLVMLSIILYMFSLCIVQIIAMHFKDIGGQLSDEERSSFETLYGSVQVSMLTLFQLTTDGANWRESYLILSKTGWFGSAVFLGFVAFTHIAVINIIMGIFVESAMQNLAPDRDSMALDHHFREEQAARELEQLFRTADKDGAGTISREEFSDLMRERRLPRLLSLLGLREQHVKDFHKFLSAGSPDGEVSITGFVRGCMKLKGSATSFDLHMLQVDVHAIQRTLQDLKHRGGAGTGQRIGSRADFN